MAFYSFPGDYFVVENAGDFAAAALRSDGQNAGTTTAGKTWFKNMKLETYDEIAALVHLVDDGKVTRYNPADFADLEPAVSRVEP